MEAEVGTRNLEGRQQYPASVRIQLEQMGDLGVPCPLQTISSTATVKLQNPYLQLPLRQGPLLQLLFRTPEQVALDYQLLVDSMHPHSDRTSP